MMIITFIIIIIPRANRGISESTGPRQELPVSAKTPPEKKKNNIIIIIIMIIVVIIIIIMILIIIAIIKVLLDPWEY